MIPIHLKLKRQVHKDIAYAQDIIIEEMYYHLPQAVIHGGTALWRCYQGNRFSEDIDVYTERDTNNIRKLFTALEKKGFIILKKRIKENSLYSTLQLNRTTVRFEALFKSIKKYIIKEYETAEGMSMNVYTLTIKDLLAEKIQTYNKRRKVRDLYDIFFLLRYSDRKEKEITGSIKQLIKEFKKPVDEEDLKTIIITGPIPTTKQMMGYLQRWVQ